MTMAKVIQYVSVWGVSVVVLASVVGCDVAQQSAGPAEPVPAWEMTLDIDGAPVTFPLEMMDVYLVEDNEQYPETFEITGQGVTLVGQFPMTIHVDYGEEWDLLVGQAIPISATVDYPGVASASSVEVPGAGPTPVVGGSFTVNKVSGTYSGSEGDMTLSGTITLDLQVSYGIKTVRGTFAVHAVTWG